MNRRVFAAELISDQLRCSLEHMCVAHSTELARDKTELYESTDQSSDQVRHPPPSDSVTTKAAAAVFREEKQTIPVFVPDLSFHNVLCETLYPGSFPNLATSAVGKRVKN